MKNKIFRRGYAAKCKSGLQAAANPKLCDAAITSYDILLPVSIPIALRTTTSDMKSYFGALKSGVKGCLFSSAALRVSSLSGILRVLTNSKAFTLASKSEAFSPSFAQIASKEAEAPAPNSMRQRAA
mmetsp:Transcript_3402/g.7966  ORF Transcript_3402/g.7966 Transcript_3402/m.7966 type:complete len:127 (+) Transcript_3402:90-470(+)